MARCLGAYHQLFYLHIGMGCGELMYEKGARLSTLERNKDTSSGGAQESTE